ncbi:alpha/beta hydrolase [Loigolactobacillus backii]|nr:alpha/beta hydrolase [Loigolactobacillus backii]PIO84373.1 alpha/beta hydrolase [Loigolactobacillus backii]
MKILRLRKKLVYWLIGVLVVILLVITGASLYLYHFAFEPTPKVLSHPTAKSKLITARNKSWLAKVPKQHWHEQSATDDLRLVADYVPAAKTTEKTIVVAHGYMDNKEDMAAYIHLFHRLGYNVLAPDDRGAGASQGNYIGFGWPDRLDYLKWTKQVIHRNGQTSEIGLFGVSMGGATVMMLSGQHLPHQVKAIVEDCGYESVSAELSYELKSLYHLPKFPLLYSASIITMIRAHYNFLQASSLTALHHNHLPTFFIHGSADTFVPTRMVYKNYAATKGKKKLWITKGAHHAESLSDYPKQYRQKVGQFFAQNLN